MEVIALVISILAFLLSLFQYSKESLRQKKEATLVAYNELQNDVFTDLTTYPYPMPEIKFHGEEWNKLTVYLAKLERFSLGINTGINSIRILNRLGGVYYIREFEKLKPIIDRKRADNIVPGGHYDEFEKTVIKLRKLRNRQRILFKSWSVDK